MTTKRAARVVAYIIHEPLGSGFDLYDEFNYSTAYRLLPSFLRWKHKNKYYPECHSAEAEAQHILEVMEAI